MTRPVSQKDFGLLGIHTGPHQMPATTRLFCVCVHWTDGREKLPHHGKEGTAPVAALWE